MPLSGLVEDVNRLADRDRGHMGNEDVAADRLDDRGDVRGVRVRRMGRRAVRTESARTGRATGHIVGTHDRRVDPTGPQPGVGRVLLRQ